MKNGTLGQNGQLVKCVYFVLTENGFLLSDLTSLVVWIWITIWVYWYGIGTFGIG